jgi:hypothetical protein
MAPNTVRQPSPSTGISILYLTVGILMTIWSAVWYYFLNKREELPPYDWKYFVCIGLFFSGLAISIIGLLVGRIGKAAQNADIPVGQVTSATVQPTGTAGQPIPAQPVLAQPAIPVQPVAPAPNGPAPARTIPSTGS